MTMKTKEDLEKENKTLREALDCTYNLFSEFMDATERLQRRQIRYNAKLHRLEQRDTRFFHLWEGIWMFICLLLLLILVGTC